MDKQKRDIKSKGSNVSARQMKSIKKKNCRYNSQITGCFHYEKTLFGKVHIISNSVSNLFIFSISFHFIILFTQENNLSYLWQQKHKRPFHNCFYVCRYFKSKNLRPLKGTFFSASHAILFCLFIHPTKSRDCIFFCEKLREREKNCLGSQRKMKIRIVRASP